MVEEKVVTLRFSKETLKSSPISLIQQSHGQASKIASQKGKGPKQESDGGSSSYSTEQRGENKCWRCGGSHWKKDCLNPPQPTTPNPNPSQPCSHCKAYGHDANHYLMFHLKLRQGQSQARNARKSLGFGKGQKAKSAANKGLATKLAPNQPNAMEASFAHLEAPVMNMASNMVTLVKPTTH